MRSLSSCSAVNSRGPVPFFCEHVFVFFASASRPSYSRYSAVAMTERDTVISDSESNMTSVKVVLSFVEVCQSLIQRAV